ncbi:MAG TPA: hypothetical protein VKV02_07595, partial [Acidobacteriaceae bacterium]|nr:hypothetical protein [Acidobacteriaceae bacterium]
ETSTGQLSTPAATPTPAGPAPTPTTNPSAYPFHFKPVGQPPTDCGSGNRVYDCNDSDPNNGLQYIQGHVLDAKGNGLSGYNVRMDFYGNSLTVGTEGDGLFTLILSNNCPIQTRVYTVYIVDGQGHQASDKHEVDYSNCNTAGVFHFDFVRNS